MEIYDCNAITLIDAGLVLIQHDHGWDHINRMVDESTQSQWAFLSLNKDRIVLGSPKTYPCASNPNEHILWLRARILSDCLLETWAIVNHATGDWGPKEIRLEHNIYTGRFFLSIRDDEGPVEWFEVMMTEGIASADLDLWKYERVLEPIHKRVDLWESNTSEA